MAPWWAMFAGHAAMVVVGRFDDRCGIATELSSMGYGYSVLDQRPTCDDYDLDSCIEMFSDWGSMNERAPDCMN